MNKQNLVKNSKRNITLTIVVMLVIMGITPMFSTISVSAIPIEETGEGGELIWNDTYFLTDPVNIMVDNDDALTNHYPCVYGDKVAWVESNLDGSTYIVYHNLTTGEYQWLNSSDETYISFTKPLLTDKYLIAYQSNDNILLEEGFGMIFDTENINENNSLYNTSNYLEKDMYTANNEYFVYGIDSSDRLYIVNFSNNFNDLELSKNMLEPDYYFTINDTYYSLTGGILNTETQIMSLNENNELFFYCIGNGSELGLMKYNIISGDFELFFDQYSEYMQVNPINMHSFIVNNNYLWFTSYFDALYRNAMLFDIMTKEIMFNSSNEILYKDSYIQSLCNNTGLYLNFYSLNEGDTFISNLTLINFLTNETHEIKNSTGFGFENYITENIYYYNSHRFNIYQYPNGTYIIIDDNYAFNPTRSYTPDGNYPSIMVMYLIPITESEEEPELDSDEDGLPDEWELEYFGDLNQTGDDDFDGDGFTNQEEYDEETDPTDDTDYPETEEEPEITLYDSIIQMLIGLLPVLIILFLFSGIIKSISKTTKSGRKKK